VNKLFLRIYMPLALGLIATILVSALIAFHFGPARARDYHMRTLNELRNRIVAEPGVTPARVHEIAEEMGVDAETVPLPPHGAGGPPPMPEPGFLFMQGLPDGMGFLVKVPVYPEQGRFMGRYSIWLFVTVLLAAQGIVLMLSLGPLRRRMRALDGAARRIGSGDLSARVGAPHDGDLLDSLGETFDSMAGRIQELVASHQELLGSVAHELRTPLARIRFALELLRGSGSVGDAAGIDAMERDVTALDALLTELLTFNRISRTDRLDTGPIDLSVLVGEAMEIEGFAFPGIEYSVEGSATLAGDARLLERALSNVIRNAFAHASSRVHVALSSAHGRVEAVVEDDGPGFDRNLQERLGKPFTKGPDSTGSGLGLATAESIAALHGGSVEYGKAVIGGARVRLMLPVDQGRRTSGA
jgi:two-component system, OmpR family, sensor histidine kinase RstB